MNPDDMVKSCGCGKQYTKGKNQCPSCYMKARYAIHRVAILARQKQAKEEDPVGYKQKRDRWKEANKENINEQKRERRKVIRQRCIDYYSSGTHKCAICGEDTLEFLALDHISGGGKQHGIHDLYEWAHARKFPPIFQVLCHNCNFAKSNSGAKRPAAQRAKFTVMSHYSAGNPICKCCGCDDIRILALDHMSDGSQHRKQLGIQGGYKMYLWCIRNNFPPIFQVLCHNCNFAKWAHGVCVHKPRLK